MPDSTQIIESLKQVRSTRGGKVIVTLSLLLAVPLGYILLMRALGFPVNIDGMWKYALYFDIICFLLTIAFGIWSIVFRSKVEGVVAEKADTTTSNINQNTRKQPYFVNQIGNFINKENGFRRWARIIVLVWISAILVGGYALMCILLVRDGLIPTVQNLIASNFNFTTDTLVQIFISLMMSSMLIMFPLLMYLDATKKQRKKR
jgi:hypothetical protein